MADRVSGIEGLVARIVTDDELVINKGSSDGVDLNMIFEVLDPLTQNVQDPVTFEDLGSIERVKAEVRVTRIQDRLSLARITPYRVSALTDVARIVSGVPTTSRLTSEIWPEGVKRGDPVRFTGRWAAQPLTSPTTPSP
jgi:hypothetical protein